MLNTRQWPSGALEYWSAGFLFGIGVWIGYLPAHLLEILLYFPIRSFVYFPHLFLCPSFPLNSPTPLSFSIFTLNPFAQSSNYFLEES